MKMSAMTINHTVKIIIAKLRNAHDQTQRFDVYIVLQLLFPEAILIVQLLNLFTAQLQNK